jgi:recombination protein RecR
MPSRIICCRINLRAVRQLWLATHIQTPNARRRKQSQAGAADAQGRIGQSCGSAFLARRAHEMTPAFEKLQKHLKALPGLGHRSSERIALNLLVERPERLPALVEALQEAARSVRRCSRCGNLAEGELCPICADERRDSSVVCVVEHVPDLVALERSAAYRGVYQVLQGKLSPLNGVGPGDLNIAPLVARVADGAVQEVILALSNDVEGEATCHYLTEQLLSAGRPVKITRIGFGLPSGGGVLYADSVTLRSALDGRRSYS